MYTARTDCVQDWGADPAQCEPVRRTTTSGGSSYTHYYGPSYAHGSHGSSSVDTLGAGTTSEARPGSRAMGTAHVTRGGFGSSASSHGAGSRGT